MKTIKVQRWSEVPINFTGIAKFTGGTKYWYKNGKLHREDGPAIEWADGEKRWWLEGKFYPQINLNDFVILGHYKGKHGIMWYKILTKDEIVEYPDIPGLITK